MTIHFYKYQGTGNDFVILDNRKGQIHLDKEKIASLCDRRFGVGADGLMLLNECPGYDFEMKYYNADGGESSMCGNGGRCLVKFAGEMGIQKSMYRFFAIDGLHEAFIKENGDVALKMIDVTAINDADGKAVLNTGSPHYVEMVNDLEALDVFSRGREIRYSGAFAAGGINVNFVEKEAGKDFIKVRTYERGVEAETFSCGTGVTAAALVVGGKERGRHTINVETKGGKLSVTFEKHDSHFTNIWLIGPAEKVFEGDLTI